jgi:hypothetical protein
MPAKISAEMKRALALVKSGSSVYAAAKACGIQHSTILRSRLYLEWLAGQQSHTKK